MNKVFLVALSTVREFCAIPIFDPKLPQHSPFFIFLFPRPHRLTPTLTCYTLDLPKGKRDTQKHRKSERGGNTSRCYSILVYICVTTGSCLRVYRMIRSVACPMSLTKKATGHKQGPFRHPSGVLLWLCISFPHVLHFVSHWAATEGKTPLCHAIGHDGYTQTVCHLYGELRMGLSHGRTLYYGKSGSLPPRQPDAELCLNALTGLGITKEPMQSRECKRGTAFVQRHSLLSCL